MAGSKRQMLYKTDIPDAAGTGRKYVILNLDESNSILTGGVEATDANIAGKEFAQDGIDYQSKGLKPRYILIEGTTSTNQTVRRKLVACDPDNAYVKDGGNFLQAVFVGGNVTEDVSFAVTGVVGEKRTFRRSTDSGLTDGTPD